jgi:hypothetical protein
MVRSSIIGSIASRDERTDAASHGRATAPEQVHDHTRGKKVARMADVVTAPTPKPSPVRPVRIVLYLWHPPALDERTGGVGADPPDPPPDAA